MDIESSVEDMIVTTELVMVRDHLIPIGLRSVRGVHHLHH